MLNPPPITSARNTPGPLGTRGERFKRSGDVTYISGTGPPMPTHPACCGSDGAPRVTPG